MFNHVLLSAVLLSLLGGCCSCRIDPEVSRTEKHYTVIGITPQPFRVSLKALDSGEVFANMPVATRCNLWWKLKVGSTWTFTEVVRAAPLGRYSEIHGVQSLCDRLSSLPDVAL